MTDGLSSAFTVSLPILVGGTLPGKIKHLARILGGVGLCLLGITGLIMPIMPGWVFLIPGLIILADYFPPIRRLVDWAKKKVASTGVAGGGTDPGADPESPPDEREKGGY